MAGWSLAPNVAQVNRDVRSSGFLSDLGTIGDTRHLEGAGDHTPYSTHVGKYGYPTQEQVHAQDIGGSDFYLDLIETFIRRSWRRGELAGLKYFNALNRHWNIQSWASWEMAKAGTLQSSYSPDHHVHLSFENGGVDGDLVARFEVWLNNGQSFGSGVVGVGELEDEMGVSQGVVAVGDVATVFGVPEVTDDRWVKLTFASDFGAVKLRVAIHFGSGWDLRELVVKDTDNRVNAGFNLPKGANKVSVVRQDGKTVPVSWFVEYK